MSSQAAPATGQFQSQNSARPSRGRAGCCRRGRRCARRSSPAVDLGEPAASAAASSRWGRSGRVACAGGPSTPARSANSVGEGVEAEAAGAGVSSAATASQRVEGGVEVGLPPRAARRPRLDVLQAEHHPVVVVVAPEQPRGRDAGGQAASLRASSR